MFRAGGGFSYEARARPVRTDRLTYLYRTYGPAIYARCRLLLADPSAAEDATQETFLRVHRHLDRVPSAREGLYWIYRVATNYCLNHLRDQRARPEPRGDLPEPAPSSTPRGAPW